LAKAIAKETKAVFINISLSTMQDKWFGESQKLVRAVFTLAWALQVGAQFVNQLT
jgi:SpoVK/Ycf46/Vps4 family AAA+-type ATPase